MSIFEALMLICFGAAWPFSIYRGIKSRSIAGKSPVFSGVILTGYVFGMLNKVIYNFDFVFYLYALNFVMVSADLLIYLRNRRFSRRS